MGRIEKVLARMRANPRGDWRIEDFKRVAQSMEIDWDHDGTHVSVPAHKPIKSIYVKKFLALVHRVEKNHENS